MSVTRQQLRQMILAEATEMAESEEMETPGITDDGPAKPQDAGEEDPTELKLGANLGDAARKAIMAYHSPERRQAGHVTWEDGQEAVKTANDIVKLIGREDADVILPTLFRLDSDQLATFGRMLPDLVPEGGVVTAGMLRRLISEIADPSGRDTTLMTVGQFRRLVREAAGGGGTGDIRDFLDDLNTLGLNAANILDRLRAEVYDDTDRSELANWLEGQPITDSWSLLMNWLDHREPELAREDLEGLLKLQMGSRDPHPAEDQQRRGEAAENEREEMKLKWADMLEQAKIQPHSDPDFARKLFIDNLKAEGLLGDVDNPAAFGPWLDDDTDAPLPGRQAGSWKDPNMAFSVMWSSWVGFKRQHQLDESVVMTLGQFRRMLREQCEQYWDPFNEDAKDYAAQRLIVTTQPEDWSEKDWRQTLKEYLEQIADSPSAAAEFPRTEVIDNFNAKVKEVGADLGDKNWILKTRILSTLRGME